MVYINTPGGQELTFNSCPPGDFFVYNGKNSMRLRQRFFMDLFN